MADSTSGASDKFNGYRNRLGLEKSPYLLQHANNPVDWYSWGDEAFAKAKSEDKPIFLSVGYSTCHWCHVMEHESFENEEVGSILNESFVSVKVDREERPDVDRVYMSFIQATQGGGGWPMSVWLTPDLRPIVGGTYFPPDDGVYGQTGFKSILRNISKTWRSNRRDVQEQGDFILNALTQSAILEGSKRSLPNATEIMNKCYTTLAHSYDKLKGGFGRSPKFPQPVNFNFMLRMYAEDRESASGKGALEMTLNTLRMMARGGIRDHVGQGFHRYSTDGDWHVPHFEKMLYDQGQLAVTYAEAHQITKDKMFADVLRDILKYVGRDLSDKSGGFYSAEDADSFPSTDSEKKREGAFCVWTYEEIQKLLNEPLHGGAGATNQDKAPNEGEATVADMFSFHYQVMKSGNVDEFKDPHKELLKQNVLIVKGSLEETAGKFSLTVDETRSILEKSLDTLWEYRQKRPKPHLDNKIVTAWNGLMISGYARAAQTLDDDSYAKRAQLCAEFVRKELYRADTGVLLRSCYIEANSGKIVLSPNPVEGFVHDYSMLIRGLLDLYEACYDEKLLEWCEKLQEKQDSLFLDTEHGGYFTTNTVDQSIVLRLKEDQDGAEPSSNSVSSHNLLRLASFLNRPEWGQQAVLLMAAFTERLEQAPHALPELVGALMFQHNTAKQIIIRGDLKSAETQALLRCIHSHFLPNKVLVVDSALDGESSFLRGKVPLLATLPKLEEGRATAYVCENYTCKLPVTSVAELEKLLV